MKPIKPLFALVIVAIALLTFSCLPDCTPIRDVRIKSFLWENVRYQTEYSKDRLLKKLKASDRDIIFYYDEGKKLYKAKILFHGASSPESVFEYVQGEHGITRITWKRDGIIAHIVDFVYDSTGTLVFLDNAMGESSDPYAHQTLDLTYTGENVSRLLYSINGNPFTQQRTESFDDKINPFRMLAASVGNPAFFPVGAFVFFQVGDYNIPYISWLGYNNPGDLIYETTYPGFVQNHTMSYTYSYNMVTKIDWGNPFGAGRTFEFEYAFY